MEKRENTLKKELDSALDEIFEFSDIPGISAGILCDSEIFTAVRGWKNYITKEKLCKSNTFCCCSVSKIFTSLGIMKLVEEGKVSLGDKAVDIIPNLSIDDRRYIKDVAIEKLLSHGMGHEGKFLYSDRAYDILGKAIEEISGECCWDFMHGRIFSECGITDMDTDRNIMAYPHFRKMDRSITVLCDYYSGTHGLMSGGLVVTAEGILKMGGSVMKSASGEEGSFLSKKTCRVMWEKKLQVTGTSEYIGLGWFISEKNGRLIVGHDGGNEGFSASFWMCPEKNAAVCVLSNLCGAPARKAAMKIMRLVF